MVWRGAGGAEEEVGEEPGPPSAPTDKLLFTVQIYDCFYGPNRKAARFTVANGTGAVGGPLETHTSPPPPPPAPPLIYLDLQHLLGTLEEGGGCLKEGVGHERWVS